MQNPINKFEKIPTQVFENSQKLSAYVAAEIAAVIKEKQQKGEKCVLGLVTGKTVIPLYQELVRMHKEEGLSFHNVITFGVDEYYKITSDNTQSYSYFMHQYLYNYIDIEKENINMPDGNINSEELVEWCKSYEEKIESCGGIDLQILGIGRTGHIGFNEPGSTQASRTRFVALDPLTRRDASNSFGGAAKVPACAITMGVGTILQAKRIILYAYGEHKAPIINEILTASPSDQVPASFLQNHGNTQVLLDELAASQLTRCVAPWLMGPCRWDNQLIKKAVLWLCQKLKKPILKLTEKDYIDNGLSDVLVQNGAAYNTNIDIFNKIQHTITGWPGGKPNADDTYRPERAEPAHKKVLIFSPHPDDDIISMGGTLIRLVDQKHDVHVAYQVSGNFAVSDHHVTSFTEFTKEYAGVLGLEDKKYIEDHFDKIHDFFARKRDGEIDTPEVRKIKGLIRRGEARSASRYVNLSEDKLHFLDLPFYETGTLEKKPVSQDDIDIVKELLEELKPHQIYAAGDLADPHGTHKVCLDAVFEAIAQLKAEGKEWLNDCYVWLYKGAWQEWDIDLIEMAVPLSPSELMKKRQAIFRHASQKDDVPFLGEDNREFWQRAEDRNRTTANLYNLLGMAEYEAIEAFVRYHF